MFINQFILTYNKKIIHLNDFNTLELSDNWYLHTHKDVTLTTFKNKHENLEQHFILLGDMYDWESPEYSNLDILNDLKSQNHMKSDTLLEKIGKYSGDHILIYNLGGGKKWEVVNDCSAQYELFYHTDFEALGSQPKIIQQIIPNVNLDNSPDAIKFFNSSVFNKKKLFIGENTHIKEIKQLLPNHYIDLEEKQTKRFFPIKKRIEKPLDEVAKKMSVMIKGVMKSISIRHSKIELSLTAGYDSRVLFLASLDLDITYSVVRYPYMKDDFHDLVIPKKLIEIYGKKLIVKNSDYLFEKNTNQDFLSSVDFPLGINYKNDPLKEHVDIIGSVSEICRNLYDGAKSNLSAKETSIILDYKNITYTRIKIQKWLNTTLNFTKKFDYNILDFIYWDFGLRRISKNYTVSRVQGKKQISPYNNRDYISLGLSTNRKYRDNSLNILYDNIIKILSDNNSEVIKTKLNPVLKKNIIKYMKLLRVYNIYRFLYVKLLCLKYK